MRVFPGGATRNSNINKISYTGFYDPEVVHAFGEYMNKHRKNADGTMREPDNWKNGIPREVLIESLVRHVVDLWRVHAGGVAIDPDTGAPCEVGDLCCAIMFNIQAYLREVIKS